jgi:hypothetical protein
MTLAILFSPLEPPWVRAALGALVPVGGLVVLHGRRDAVTGAGTSAAKRSSHQTLVPDPTLTVALEPNGRKVAT